VSRRRRAGLASLALGLAVAACGDDGAGGYEDGEELAGGEAATSFDGTRTALTRPAPALAGDRLDGFFVGNSIFNRNWVTAPSSTEGLDGLGPTFNASSCSACHLLDGRGRPPRPGEAMLSSLVRLSIAGDGGPVAEPSYGDQFQPSSILGVPGEGLVELTWIEEPGSYGDGTAYSLRRPVIGFTDLGFGPMSEGVMTSLRVAPPVAGLGLLELVAEADIVALADPDDADGDGISGRPNRVVDVRTGQPALGRFGWKSNQPSIFQQSAGAFLGDIGITSSLFPGQNCPPAQTACAAAPDGTGGDGVEVTDDKLARITYYGMTLAAAGRRHVRDPDVLRGKRLFTELGCAGCHTPVLTTGDSAELPELAHQVIRPYSDLLLHDMGDGLADGRPDGLADGREWRTPPLWGIGLIEIVNGHDLFLHDGRARGFAEAILWHGGEAEAAREGFRTLDADDRAAVLRFLESL
jgi:CxxC motif-containing protein (DUF1111 family)